MTRERAGRVFSRVRNSLRDADAVRRCGRPHPVHRYREVQRSPARSQTPCTYGSTSNGNREIPGPPRRHHPQRSNRLTERESDSRARCVHSLRLKRRSSWVNAIGPPTQVIELAQLFAARKSRAFRNPDRSEKRRVLVANSSAEATRWGAEGLRMGYFSSRSWRRVSLHPEFITAHARPSFSCRLPP